MEQQKTEIQVYKVLTKQPDGSIEAIYGKYSADLTEKTKTKAAFYLVHDLKGKPKTIFAKDEEGRKINFTYYNTFAINQHGMLCLFSMSSEKVHSAHCGSFVSVQPPLIGLSNPPSSDQN